MQNGSNVRRYLECLCCTVMADQKKTHWTQTAAGSGEWTVWLPPVGLLLQSQVGVCSRENLIDSSLLLFPSCSASVLFVFFLLHLHAGLFLMESHVPFLLPHPIPFFLLDPYFFYLFIHFFYWFLKIIFPAFWFFKERFLCVALAAWNSFCRPGLPGAQRSPYPC